MGDGNLCVLEDDVFRGGDSQEQKDVQSPFACDTTMCSPRSRQRRYSLRSYRPSEGDTRPLVKKVTIERSNEILEQGG